MNVSMSVDEFHEVIMLYLINLTNETRTTLSNPDDVVFTPEFDDFLRFLQNRPLGKMRGVYIREDARTRLLYNRMKRAMPDSEGVRLTL